MRRLQDLLQRFHRDERGVFAVFFAIIALALIATSGAVVDFTSIQQTRTRAQTVLDSAALGLQPTISQSGVTAATLKVKAQALLTERLADTSITATVTNAVVNITNGTLEFDATVSKPTAFVRMVGITSLSAKLVSQATRKQLDLEVAMVLDNSGSMATNSRMTNLQLAARCATDVLFNGTSDCTTGAKITTADALTPVNTNVRIALIPFTEFVNVGTGYSTATWMDQVGNNTVSRSGFDNDDDSQTAYTGSVNRFTLFSTLGITWQGCVEARNHVTGAGGLYYDTSDLTPDTATPDSLFDPIFSVDEKSAAGADDGGYPNSWIGDRPAQCPVEPIYTQTQVKTQCTTQATSVSNYNSASCSGTTTNTYTQTVGGVTTSSSATSPATLLHLAVNSAYSEADSGVKIAKNNYTNTRVRTYSYATFPDRVLQERLCKYTASNTQSFSTSAGPGGRTGPNAECPNTILLPLTTTKATIISRIKAMSADGGTNIHQGITWGYHALSPGEPLTQGKPYTSATSKVMIVMTDGENTNSYSSAWVGGTWYTAYGYPYNGRLTGASTALLQTEMDNRTKTTCTNAKNDGIVVYTIGLSPPNQTTIDMLTNCATDSTKAYFPANSSDLTTVFQTIAAQLADLRLAL